MKETDNTPNLTERNIVDIMTGRANFRSNISRMCHVPDDDGNILFSFKIHPLTEDELNKCRRQNIKNRGQRNETVDWNRYASACIYEATDESDKKRLWQNPEVREKLGVATGVDVVHAVLKPAERARYFSEIETISGYDDSQLDSLISDF